VELDKAVAAELFSGSNEYKPVYIDMEYDILQIPFEHSVEVR
tara:strand:+ start:16346 stop:16471 length:126 start_codon:yes stop_codon:yes gene_type:complete